MSSASESQLFRGIVESQLAALLRLIRADVAARSWDTARLPPWVSATRVRSGLTGPTALAVFSASRDAADHFRWKGFIHCDVSLLLECPDYHPISFVLDTTRPRPDNRPLLLSGDRTDKSVRGRSAIRLSSRQPGLTNCEWNAYHPPVMLSEMVIELMSAPEEFGSLKSGIVPFAIFVHSNDLRSAPALWGSIGDPVMRSLERCHNRSLGQEYAEERRRTSSLMKAEGSLQLAKESGVVVLGHDSSPDLAELERVCDRLRADAL